MAVRLTQGKTAAMNILKKKIGYPGKKIAVKKAKLSKEPANSKPSGNKPVAGERILLVLVDNRTDDVVNKAAYYVAVRAKKMRERLALIYVREPAEMQLFGISDIMRQESKEESAVQIQQLTEHIRQWAGKKQEVMSYVREGEVSEAVCDFIAKNRFVSGLVVTNWQIDNIANGLYGYISGASRKNQIRQVPVTIIPEDADLSQLEEAC